MKSPMDIPERYHQLSSNVKWKLADDFRRLLKQFHLVGPNVSLTYQGSTPAIHRLYDVTKPPPSVVANHPETNGEFVCWLQLPLEKGGTKWSFGRVLCRDAPAQKFDVFCRAAREAGSCLRNNRRFREWLTPILDYTSQANRLPQLLDQEDVSWWLALLLMKPDLLKPQAKHGAAFVEIPNVGGLSSKAIRSWRLATATPNWPVQSHVVRPFVKAIADSETSEATTPSKRGRKRATVEEIEKACEVWIDYERALREGKTRNGFLAGINGDKTVAKRGVKWLDKMLALCRKVQGDGRVPEKFTNKLKPLRRVKRRG